MTVSLSPLSLYSPQQVLLLALTSYSPGVYALCTGTGCDILGAAVGTFLLMGIALCCGCCHIPAIIAHSSNSNARNSAAPQIRVYSFGVLAVALWVFSTFILVRTSLALGKGHRWSDLWWLVAVDAVISLGSALLSGYWWTKRLAIQTKQEPVVCVEVEVGQPVTVG